MRVWSRRRGTTDVSEQVTVARLPNCDMCGPGVPAEFDAKTERGPWANMCFKHYKVHGIGLGTGKGQRLVLKWRDPR